MGATKAMSKSKALALASSAVGKPYGSGTSWTFNTPYHRDKLDGPTTPVSLSSYAATCYTRRLIVVETALRLMGVDGYVCPDRLDGSAKDMLDAVLANPSRHLA